MTRIYGPSDSAPVTTEKVAHCQACGAQWQVQSTIGEDAKGCAFCGAGEKAITIVSEAPGYEGAIVT